MSDRVLTLTVFVGYTGLKATQYFSKFAPEAVDTLFRDLDVLKLPHPQKKNVAQVRHGCVKFWWPQVFDTGVLRKHLHERINGYKRDDDALQALSISTLSLQEEVIAANGENRLPPEPKRANQQVINAKPRGKPSSAQQNIPSKRPLPAKPPLPSNKANLPRPGVLRGQAQEPSGDETEVSPEKPPKRRKVGTEPTVPDARYPPMRFQPASSATSSSSSASYPPTSSLGARLAPPIPPSHAPRFSYPQPYPPPNQPPPFAPPPPPPPHLSDEYTPFQPWLTSRPSVDNNFANHVWPPAHVPAGPPRAVYPASTVPSPQQAIAQVPTQAPIPVPPNPSSPAGEAPKATRTGLGEGDDKFTIVELLRKASQTAPALASATASASTSAQMPTQASVSIPSIAEDAPKPTRMGFGEGDDKIVELLRKTQSAPVHPAASASASTSLPRVNSATGMTQPQGGKRTESLPAGSTSQLKTLLPRDARSHFVRSSMMGATSTSVPAVASTSTPMQALQTLQQLLSPGPTPQLPFQGLPTSAASFSLPRLAPSQSEVRDNLASSATTGAASMSVPAVVSASAPVRTAVLGQPVSPAPTEPPPTPQTPLPLAPTSAPIRTAVSGQSHSAATAQPPPAPQPPFQSLPSSASFFSLPRSASSQSDVGSNYTSSATTAAAPASVSALVPTLAPVRTEIATTQLPPAPHGLSQGIPYIPSPLSNTFPVQNSTNPAEALIQPTQASRARTVSVPPAAAGTWRESPVKEEPEELTIDLTAPVPPSSSSTTSYSDLLKSITAASSGAISTASSSAPVVPKTETREDAIVLEKSTSYSGLLKSITAFKEAAAPAVSAPGSAGHRSASASQTSSRAVSEDVRWLEAELSGDSPMPPPPSSSSASWPESEMPRSTPAATPPRTYSDLLKSIRASATGSEAGGALSSQQSRHSVASDATQIEALQAHTPAPPTPSTPTSYSDLLKSLSGSKETPAPASARMGIFVLDGTSPVKPVISSSFQIPTKAESQVEESSADRRERSASGVIDMDLGTPRSTPGVIVGSRISTTPANARKSTSNPPATRDISLPYIETWVNKEHLRTELAGLPPNSEIERSLKRAEMEMRILNAELDARSSKWDEARKENNALKARLEEERNLRSEAERVKTEVEERRKENNALKGQLEGERNLLLGAERAKAAAEEERRKENNALKGQLEEERSMRVEAERVKAAAEEEWRKANDALKGHLEEERNLRVEAEGAKAKALEERRKLYVVLKQQLADEQKLRAEAEQANAEVEEERRKEKDALKGQLEDERNSRLEAERAKVKAEEERRGVYDTVLKQIQALKQRLEEEQGLRVEAERTKAETEERAKEQVEEERRLRVVAEEALADVKRECREPFVVPALFDAFMSISKLTTKVVGKKD